MVSHKRLHLHDFRYSVRNVHIYRGASSLFELYIFTEVLPVCSKCTYLPWCFQSVRNVHIYRGASSLFVVNHNTANRTLLHGFRALLTFRKLVATNCTCVETSNSPFCPQSAFIFCVVTLQTAVFALMFAHSVVCDPETEQLYSPVC